MGGKRWRGIVMTREVVLREVVMGERGNKCICSWLTTYVSLVHSTV